MFQGHDGCLGRIASENVWVRTGLEFASGVFFKNRSSKNLPGAFACLCEGGLINQEDVCSNLNASEMKQSIDPIVAVGLVAAIAVLPSSLMLIKLLPYPTVVVEASTRRTNSVNCLSAVEL
jgi:hypothetical protein